MTSKKQTESSLADLNNMLAEYSNELMNLRVQKSIGQLSAPHRLRAARRNIARVKTLIHLAKIAES